jgi:anti-sigma-K factor RskA
MSESEPMLSKEEAREARAAELALGLLTGDERRAAEAEARRDPAFAEAAAAWAQRFVLIADEVPPRAPPARVWERISHAIGPQPIPIEPARAAKAARDQGAGARFWRAWAVASTGLAAACAAGVVYLATRPPPEPQHPMIATLASPDGAATVVVAFDPDTGALFVSPTPSLQPGQHSPHLWLLEPGGAVRLVGPINPAAPATHSLPEPLALEALQAVGVAVSLEPPGHTPTDAPGGPVVAQGQFSKL